MEDKLRERILTVFKYKGVNPNSISKTQAEQRKLNRQISEGAAVTFDVIYIIISLFDDISIEWLITGEGDMLKSDASLTDRTKESTAIDKEQDSSAIYERMIEKKDKRIEELALMVGSLQKEVEILKQDKKIVLESDDASNAVERLILTGTDDR